MISPESVLYLHMTINNAKDLLRHVGVQNEAQLSKAIRKGTDAGISVNVKEDGVFISTAVENCHAEFSETLSFPFKSEEFWWVLESIDNAACEAFDEQEYLDNQI